MAVMLGDLYTALTEAGVSSDRAQRAAQEAAAQTDVTKLQDKVDRLVSRVDVLTLMTGFLLASTIGGFTLVLHAIAH